MNGSYYSNGNEWSRKMKTLDYRESGEVRHYGIRIALVFPSPRVKKIEK